MPRRPHHKGQPTVILAKTVKGFGLGKAAEGQMVAHQQKKLDEEALRAVRDRFNIPLTDEQVSQARAGQADRRQRRR